MSLKFILPDESFLTGVSRTFDLGGRMAQFIFVRKPRISSAEKLGSDFRAVGKDLSKAISKTTGQLDSIAASSKRYSKILQDHRLAIAKQDALERALETLLSEESSSQDVDRLVRKVLSTAVASHASHSKVDKKAHRKDR
jgi:hypothetical protein